MSKIGFIAENVYIARAEEFLIDIEKNVRPTQTPSISPSIALSVRTNSRRFLAARTPASRRPQNKKRPKEKSVG